MKHIFFILLATIGLISCGNTAQNAQNEANANTQNPIMPIVFVGENTEVVLTDYLPALTEEDEVVFSTEPSYQVSNVTAESITLNGDHTLSILSVDVPAKGLHYDIPIVPQSQYEVGLATKSFSDSTITISVLNNYEHLQFRVLWQDTRAKECVEYEQYGTEATITIEPAWRESKGRSFVRVYAYADGKHLNDLLIPMQDGKVVYRSLSPEDGWAFLHDSRSVTLADVRTADVFAESHLPGSVNLPIAELNPSSSSKLGKRNKTILVYCQSGTRSKQATKALYAYGFTDVYDIGGMAVFYKHKPE